MTLRDRADQAVAALRDRDFSALAAMVGSGSGVAFSPYGYVDSATAVTLTPAELRDPDTLNRVRVWGSFDGSGDPIEMTFADYYDAFVYDGDFAAADSVSADRRIGMGNTLDNLASEHPDARVVEYHLPGTNPEYGGMDWRSLRLVFQNNEGEWHLVAIVHDQWTI